MYQKLLHKFYFNFRRSIIFHSRFPESVKNFRYLILKELVTSPYGEKNLILLFIIQGTRYYFLHYNKKILLLLFAAIFQS